MLFRMQVAFVDAFGKTPVLREWNAPSPGLGQIVLTTEASRVRHTDMRRGIGANPGGQHARQRGVAAR